LAAHAGRAHGEIFIGLAVTVVVHRVATLQRRHAHLDVAAKPLSRDAAEDPRPAASADTEFALLPQAGDVLVYAPITVVVFVVTLFG